jgi:hypothetical protein
MAPKPQRRAEAAPLESRLSIVERALLARAGDLENLALSARGASAATGEEIRVSDDLTHETAAAIASEFRKLAEELHYWLWPRSSSARTSPARSASSTASTSPAIPTSSCMTRTRCARLTSRCGHRPWSACASRKRASAP